MTTKRFDWDVCEGDALFYEDGAVIDYDDVVELLNELHKENELLKKELKRCKDWINSDKNDYELTLAFIKSKGYSLRDVLEYEKELKK